MLDSLSSKHGFFFTDEIVAVVAFDLVDLNIPNCGMSVVFSYVDGVDAAAVSDALNYLRNVAAQRSASLVSGCVPQLEWLTEIAKDAEFSQGTDMEQWMYEWSNQQNTSISHDSLGSAAPMMNGNGPLINATPPPGPSYSAPNNCFHIPVVPRAFGTLSFYAP